MEWESPAFVLSARLHGETGALADLLTEDQGRYVVHVAGGASRRMRPFLQPGARVMASYRARTSENLGAARLEPFGEGPAALFDDPVALAGLAAAAAVAQGALPEREPHPGAYYALEAFSAALTSSEIWPAVYVRFEAGLLDELGFGLDLSRCAATGVVDDLVYVSPKSGRAVSRDAGKPFCAKLLKLPSFMLSSQGGLRTGDVGDGLVLTGHFLERFVFAALNRPLPPARVWLQEKLAGAGRL